MELRKLRHIEPGKLNLAKVIQVHKAEFLWIHSLSHLPRFIHPFFKFLKDSIYIFFAFISHLKPILKKKSLQLQLLCSFNQTVLNINAFLNSPFRDGYQLSIENIYDSKKTMVCILAAIFLSLLELSYLLVSFCHFSTKMLGNFLRFCSANSATVANVRKSLAKFSIPQN